MGALPQQPDWLEVHRGRAPLIITYPHTGTGIPADIEARLVSRWLARVDADWWVHRLYGGGHDAAHDPASDPARDAASGPMRDGVPDPARDAAPDPTLDAAQDIARAFDATTIRTSISRSVIDVNRDPSGTSLYPGQATTGLCPVVTFDGEPLYRAALEPGENEIAGRRSRFFAPYHAALRAEIERLRAVHGAVVLYDAHSIRSRIPRLFDGLLPHFHIGTNDDRTCAPVMTRAVAGACDRPEFTVVSNGRFKGGWTVRHHGRPRDGVHAVQMELACRSYLDEPEQVAPDNWPRPFEPSRARSVRAVLVSVLEECVRFARTRSGGHA
jgi:formiminoglutamase